MREFESNNHLSPACPTLVIVCGLPATGKSSLAETLRHELGWPLFAKDQFKELLYDSVDRSDQDFTRADSASIGMQSIALLVSVAHEVLSARVSCIIEANLLPHLAPDDLAPLLQISNGRQVHCSILDDLVLERYRNRADAGKRHPVHVDSEAEAELTDRIELGGGSPLPIDVPLLPVDSTNGWRPTISEIVNFCKS